MYVYKPMAGHNLMQAIARVNRVFKDKEGGLVVDYVGIAAALKQAMNDYTARDKKNYGDTDVSLSLIHIYRRELHRGTHQGADCRTDAAQKPEADRAEGHLSHRRYSGADQRCV